MNERAENPNPPVIVVSTFPSRRVHWGRVRRSLVWLPIFLALGLLASGRWPSVVNKVRIDSPIFQRFSLFTGIVPVHKAPALVKPVVVVLSDRGRPNPPKGASFSFAAKHTDLPQADSEETWLQLPDNPEKPGAGVDSRVPSEPIAPEPSWDPRIVHVLPSLPMGTPIRQDENLGIERADQELEEVNQFVLPVSDERLDPAEVLRRGERAERLVVRITAPTTEGAGVVFHVDEEYAYAITAKHVVLKKKPFEGLKAQFRFSGPSLPVELYRAATEEDMAIVRIDLKPLRKPRAEILRQLPFDQLGAPDDLDPGDKLFTIGHSTAGSWISAKLPLPFDREDGNDAFFFDCPQGHSGGGVFDEQWRLLGIMTEERRPFCRALRIDRMMKLAQAWKLEVSLIPPLPKDVALGNDRATQFLRLPVNSTPAGADVICGGSYRGKTPMVLELTKGEHEIRLVLPGHEVWDRKVSVDGKIEVNAILEPKGH